MYFEQLVVKNMNSLDILDKNSIDTE